MEQERLRVRTQEALRKAHGELEKRVQERTAELQQAYDKLVEEGKEREQLEAQLRQAQKMEALGTLTGGIAHDFNNILAAMIGFTEIVRDRAAKESRDKHHLDRVMEAGLRGRELIKRMLAFSRKTEQEKKPILLSSVVTETMKFVRSSTPTTVSIRVNVKDESGMVFADPVQMQQVVLNLCTNAAQAMEAKGGTLDVELSDWTVDESDGGPQRDEAGTVRETRGSRYWYGHIPRTSSTGYSTPSSRQRAWERGPALVSPSSMALSISTKGTSRSRAKKARARRSPSTSPWWRRSCPAEDLTELGVPMGTERVLFVDDEELLAEMGQEILEDLGYQVTVTTSSTEALALFRSDPHQFDLVITDVTMPEITGVELAREILSLRADIPIIMCTGFSHLVDADAAKAAGVRAFTMKPLTKTGDSENHQDSARRIVLP